MLLDVRFLWLIGTGFLVLGSIGLLSIGSVIGGLLWVVGLVFDISQQTLQQVFLYSAIVWAPIGVGMGVAVTAKLTKGIRSKPKQTESEVPVS